nr:hypothetical protein [Tanacetum cinerariifolium]
MNEVYYYGQNSCYDSTSIGFDQSQPQQYIVDHPIFNAHNDYLDSQIQLNNDNIISGLPPFSAITPNEPVLSTKEPDSSLRGIDDDILLTIKDDILRKKLLNVNLLIAKIEALNANPTPSFDCKTKSSSTSLNSLLKE